MNYNSTHLGSGFPLGGLKCLSLGKGTVDEFLVAYKKCMCEQGVVGYCPWHRSRPRTTPTPWWRRRTTSRRPTTTTVRARTTGVGLTSGVSAGELPLWQPPTDTTTTATTATRNYQWNEMHRTFSGPSGPRLIFVWTGVGLVLLVFIATLLKLGRLKCQQRRDRSTPRGLARLEQVLGVTDLAGGVTDPVGTEPAPARVQPSAPRRPSDPPGDLPPPYEQVVGPSPPPYEVVHGADPGRTSAGWRYK